MDNAQKLKNYLDGNSISQKAFAPSVGIDQSVLSRILGEVIRPSLDTAAEIERETKGEIKMQDWAKEKVKGAA